MSAHYPTTDHSSTTRRICTTRGLSAEGSFVDIRCMKRFLVVVVALFTLTTTASAQSYLAPRSVGALEAELGVGLATAATDISAFGKMRQGVEVWAEARYNFGKTPVDLGVHFGLCSFSRVHPFLMIFNAFSKSAAAST